MFSPEMLLQHFSRGVRLREDAQVWKDEAGLRINARRSVTIPNPKDDDFGFIERLRVGLSVDDLRSVSPGSRSAELLEATMRIDGLRHFNQSCEVEQRFERQADWLSYYLADPATAAERISTARILVLGCGGTGAIVAQHLARSGFRHFILVDGAKIDMPDLNRQLPYCSASLGNEKAIELARFLISHEEVRVAESHVVLINSAEDAVSLIREAQADFIVSAMDQPIGKISSWIAAAAAEVRVPVVFGGIGIENATIGPLLDSPGSCHAYAQAMSDVGKRIQESGCIPKASIAFTNTIVATLLAFDVFRFFSKNEVRYP